MFIGLLVKHSTAIRCYVCTESDEECKDPYESLSSHVVECGDVGGCSKNASIGQLFGLDFKVGRSMSIIYYNWL